MEIERNGAIKLEFSGYLTDKPLALILKEISETQLTGWLSIVTQKLDLGNIYFSDGMIIYANIGNQQDRLGDELIRRGIMTEAQLQRAIRIQQEMPDRLLGSIIDDLGLASSEELKKVISEKIEQTVLRLLSWEEGYYNFAVDKAPEDKYIEVLVDTKKLIELQDEATHRLENIRSKIPDNNVVLQTVPEIFFNLDPEHFPLDHQKIIPYIDGERTVQEIIDSSHVSESTVYDMLLHLLELGAIKVRTEETTANNLINDEISKIIRYIESDDLVNAAMVCDSLLEIQPLNSHVNFYNGVILFKMKHYDKAKESFQKVMELEPDNLEAKINYALSLEKIGSYDEVINAWDMAKQAAKNDPRPLFNLGYFLYKNGNYALAKNQFLHANELDRNDPRSYFYLGLIYAREGNDSDALVNFQSALDIDRDNIKYINNTAQTSERRGMLGKAKMEYMDLLRQDPYYTKARINLADCYYQEGKFDEAKQLFNVVLKREPQSSFSLFRLGCIYFKQSDFRKAKEYWEKSLDLAPDNTALRKSVKLLEQIGS